MWRMQLLYECRMNREGGGTPPEGAPLVGVQRDAQAAGGHVLFRHAGGRVLKALQHALSCQQCFQSMHQFELLEHSHGPAQRRPMQAHQLYRSDLRRHCCLAGQASARPPRVTSSLISRLEHRLSAQV